MSSMNASSMTGSKWSAALFLHHRDRLVRGECLAVDAIARERVEYVRHRDDPSLDWDLLACEPARVAAAVPLLVVAQRNGGREVEDRRGGATEETMALLGVRLDDRPLGGRQGPGLQEDRVGDRHLPDVVQRSSVAQTRTECDVDADVIRESRREPADALDVRASVLVAELDRHRESPHGLRLGDLELGERVPELVPAVVDLAFERAARVEAEAPAGERAAREQREHARDYRHRSSRAGRDRECASAGDRHAHGRASERRQLAPETRRGPPQ